MVHFEKNHGLPGPANNGAQPLRTLIERQKTLVNDWKQRGLPKDIGYLSKAGTFLAPSSDPAVLLGARDCLSLLIKLKQKRLDDQNMLAHAQLHGVLKKLIDCANPRDPHAPAINEWIELARMKETLEQELNAVWSEWENMKKLRSLEAEKMPAATAAPVRAGEIKKEAIHDFAEFEKELAAAEKLLLAGAPPDKAFAKMIESGILELYMGNNVLKIVPDILDIPFSGAAEYFLDSFKFSNDVKRAIKLVRASIKEHPETCFLTQRFDDNKLLYTQINGELCKFGLMKDAKHFYTSFRVKDRFTIEY